MNPTACKAVFVRLEQPLRVPHRQRTGRSRLTVCGAGGHKHTLRQDLSKSIPADNSDTQGSGQAPEVLQVQDAVDCTQWPQQPWFPRLTSRTSGEPPFLSLRRDLILTPDKTTVPLAKIKNLTMTLWQVASESTELQSSLKRRQPGMQRQCTLHPGSRLSPTPRSSQDGVGTARAILRRAVGIFFHESSSGAAPPTPSGHDVQQ